MCGIVSIVTTNKVVDRQKLFEATCALKHRGPINQRCWISKNNRVGLGHARLSIIDLESGDQPLHSADDNIHIIVNGEFYDYQIIRKQLIKIGYQFKTNSDSEILLYLYQEYGVDCLHYLNGEFAFILYDEKNNVLFAARDRFGIKPLFYSLYNETLYFASECKAILNLSVPAKWNQKSIWYYLNNLPLQSMTLFENIHYVKPAHYIIAKLDNDYFVEKAYWNLIYKDENPLTFDNERDYINTFKKLFFDSVARRLQADVPVGVYLSGGIDSSAVAIAASSLSQQPITAFTIAFQQKEELNELKYASALANKLGIKLISTNVTTQDIADHFIKSLWHTEWPITNGATVAKYLLSRVVHNSGYRVVMTGEGADELMAGYPELWLECLRFSSVESDKDLYHQIEVLNNIRYPKKMKFKLLNSRILQKMSYDCILFKTQDTPFFNLMLSDEFLNQYINENIALFFLRNTLPTKPLQLRMLSSYLQIKSHFPIATLNVTGDRLEMAHSVEGRTPFLDNYLVEFISSLPNHLLANGLIEKYILREAFKKELTCEIYQRSKHAFHAPSFGDESTFKKSPIYTLMADTFYSDLLLKVPFLNAKNIRPVFREFANQQTQNELTLCFFYNVLSFCHLYNQFKIY